MKQQMNDALDAAQGTEVFIFNHLAIWGYHVAERLEVPSFLASTVPLSATRQFPFLRFSDQVNPNILKGWLNYASYILVEFLTTWQSYEIINSVRHEWDLPLLPRLGARFRKEKPRYLSPLPILTGVSPSHTVARDCRSTSHHDDLSGYKATESDTIRLNFGKLNLYLTQLPV